MNDLSQKLKLLRANVSQSEFAKKLDINPNTLRAYEQGRAQPNFDFLKKICDTLSVSPQWLMYGDDTINQNVINEKRLETEELIKIPMVQACLSAGGGSFETSSVIEREYTFTKDFITKMGNHDKMVLMRVSGDSMEPEILNNDIVLIDQSKINILASKIYAVAFEDCIYIKRIDLLPKKVVLKSVNPAYPPVVLDIQEDMASLFRVIGKVLWVGREYN